MSNTDSPKPSVQNLGYAAHDQRGMMSKWSYQIREPQENEILVRVKYCGVCHSDIHFARSEWFSARYPLVPGHEFIGEVVKLGPCSEEWKVGDIVGVGCTVDSCGDCKSCKSHWENHCRKRIGTYGNIDRFGQVTYGGYGRFVVLNKRFAIRIPEGVDYADAAPLLCAGITTYSPIMQHNFGRGNLRIGVLGLGGLGHMAVQYAAKVNETNEVIVLSRDSKKEALAKRLGAKRLVALGNATYENFQLKNASQELEDLMGTFDYIIDTVTSPSKPLALYVELLTPFGQLIVLGLPPLGQPMEFPMWSMIRMNRGIQGSLIGGVKETQDMIDFSFKNNCMPMVEHIKADQINEAMERVCKGDVMFRFVIDIEDSLGDECDR